MKRNLLLTPGPTQIPPELCEVLGRPIIHHRTPQFQQYLKESAEGIQYILQTQNDVYLLASSGTGAMEAAVCNLLSPGDTAITVEGGKFGERWGELCEAFGMSPKILKVEWGTIPTPQLIEKALQENPEAKAVFITLCETSTGVTPDVKGIGDVVKKTDAVLVVDAVSGLGVTDLQMDAWNVDVVCSGSHKGFMMPPGVGIIALSGKARKFVEQSTTPRYYFDLRKSIKAWNKTDTPFTPAINIVIGLRESLQMFREIGRENLLKKYTRLAEGTRAAVLALGLELLAKPDSISTVLTAICLPESVDGNKVVKSMRDTHGVTVAGGQGHLKGKIVRIAHMGSVDEYDILTGIACFEKVLHEQGYSFQLGAGLAAAQKVFNS